MLLSIIMLCAALEPVDRINPLMGTTYTGHCNPAAARPFAFVQPGPDTGTGSWEYCAGYRYEDGAIDGFSQNHVNGTGRGGMGDVLLLPFCGDAVLRKSRFSHDDETAQAGYYSVRLSDAGVRAEMTATDRVAFHRYTFEGKRARLLVDLQHGNTCQAPLVTTHVRDCKVEVASDRRSLRGMTVSQKNWPRHPYYYLIEFDRPFTAKVELPKDDPAEKGPRYVLDFDLRPGESLQVKVALSSRSIEGACGNMRAELPGWDFEATRIAARDAWKGLVSRLEIDGATDGQLSVAYTAIYRLCLQPNVISDAGEKPRYSTFSLWDTFRAAHPLYTLLFPEMVEPFVDSILEHARRDGWLPLWEIWGREGFDMIGNHSVPVLLDAYRKGFRFDAKEAFGFIRESLLRNHEGNGKDSWEIYDRYGYYPCDLVRTEGVSRTLECCYDDWCAAEFAHELGLADDERVFRRRADYWRNVIDPGTGYARGRKSDGTWRTPFEHKWGWIPKEFGGGCDFTEGNAWQQSFYCPHDFDGLVAARGGRERFLGFLDELFEKPLGETEDFNMTGLIGRYAQGNEGSHHIAYLYTLAGCREKTAGLVTRICRELYRPGPDGMCGNEDCGAMSAWYLFSALGFYPVNPATGEYVLGLAQFPRATVRVPGRKPLVIRRERGTSAVSFDGDELGKTVAHADLAKGGELVFREPYFEQSLALNGSWNLKAFPQPRDGAVRSLDDLPDATFETEEATVPGCCELEVAKAGLLPLDPLVFTNAIAYRAYEGHQWLYEREFVAPERAEGERQVLVFDGVDTLADYFLNGERIGETANMHIAHEFDVTGKLKSGRNRLSVLIRPVGLASRDVVNTELTGSMVADHVHFRKAEHMYGWDILPHLAVSGIWRDVRLETRAEVRFEEADWIVQRMDVGAKTASIRVRTRIHAPFELLYGSRIRAVVSRGGRVLTEKTVQFRSFNTHIALPEAKDVAFWWPRGAGDQPLYDVAVEFVDDGGKVLARTGKRFGIRTVKLEYDDRKLPERPGRFLFVVNGEPIYIRGVDWVPLDPIPSRQAALLPDVLPMMADLNCNLVRVWGGGVYEPEAFFDWCDENGVMVWQDFMMACSNPPMDDAFAAEMTREATAVVRRLRNHASMVLWAGDNENDMFSHHSPIRFNPNRNRITREVIPNVLKEYDITRPYLPSSPYVSQEAFDHKAEPCEDHLWGGERAWWKCGYITNNACWFCSEGGAHGVPSRAHLEKVMGRADAERPWSNPDAPNWKDLDWTRPWRYRSTCAHFEQDSWWNRNEIVLKQCAAIWGDVPRHDLDLLVAQSQAAQAESIKFQVEWFRSHKFTEKGGFVVWNLRDGWPTVSDAICDYYGNRKRAYAALKASYQSVMLMVTEDGRLIAVNDTLKPVEGKATVVEAKDGKTVFDGDFTVKANGIADVAPVKWNGQGLFKIEWTSDGGCGANHYLHGEPPFAWSDYCTWNR